jgi:hypothetical protein
LLLCYGDRFGLHHLHLAIFDLLLHPLLLLQHQATLGELLAVLFHVLLVLLGLVEDGERELLIFFELLLVGKRLFLLRYDCHIGVGLGEL